MKIYKAAIIGLGPSGLAVNKLIYNNKDSRVIAFEETDIKSRDNFFGFWLTDWMKPYEKLIEKKWYSWTIGNEKVVINHKENNSPYCVISYKNWMNFCLSTVNNLSIENKKVINYFREGSFYKIITSDKKEYYAENIYDSRNIKDKNNELKQHFFGINIITKNNIFDDNNATLMHFTQEEKILHFIYVLPFSKNNALVESTVFSKDVLGEDWYRDRINKYLEKLKISKFQEIGKEKGVIPMFFPDEKIPFDQNIFNIGIRGGACKPSTGYAFSFLIKQIQLLKNTNKNHVRIHNIIERKMDKLFLNYLKNNNENGNSFINLAKNLNGNEFKNFMMGQSTLSTKLKIIKSMPKLPFIKTLFN